MSTGVRNTNTLPRIDSSTVTTKKARVISKDLDRSPLQVSTKYNRTKRELTRYKNLSTSSKSQNKFRTVFGKKYTNAPSNYEANMKITHTLVRPLQRKLLTFQPTAPRCSGSYNKLPFSVIALPAERDAATLHRVVVQQYQPRQSTSSIHARTQRVRQLRRAATYSRARPFLIGTSRVRANRRVPFYAARLSPPVR